MLKESNTTKYVMVFDLDETLGHFSQLYIFWNLIKSYLNNCELDDLYFFKLLDKFPDFLRPNIIKLLINIKKKKQKGICNNVMIFTNNNGPKYWAELIKDYFNYKIKYKLFDKIIGAFKIDNQQIELCRTSHGKSHRDFINCTKLPENTQICFLDDQKHDSMENPNVLYIKIEPYLYNEDFSIMAEKFYKYNTTLFLNNNKNNTRKNFLEYIDKYTKNYQLNNLNKNRLQKNIHYLLGNHIIREIDKFFKTKPRNYTKKNKRKKRNTTKKLS
jgi:hypothetical protein